MNIKSCFNKFTILSLVLFLTVVFSSAQTSKLGTPRQEKLLNGMNLLVWNAPDTEKVTVKLRIHSGSAFDPQGKEGTMATLADLLFPEAQREYFREDLGGSLDVSSNYDYIQINATANADQFLTMMETISAAVVNPSIDKETTAKARAARLEKLKALERNSSYIADQAVANRLFGNFPYGRAQMGTSETVSKIDYADLLFAKQRFLTADNATLAVIGSVKSDLVYRAVRRNFGAWTQADKKVPATFRQPEAPDAKLLILTSPFAEKWEARYALRSFARNDKDFPASKIVIKILQNRLRGWVSKEHQAEASIYQNVNLLPNSVNISFSKLSPYPSNGKYSTVEQAVTENEKPFRKMTFDILFSQKITNEEMNKGKSEYLSEIDKNNPADLWLDVNTFKLVSVNAEFSKINDVTLADVQRVAENLQKQTVVSVILKNKDEVKQ